jgi:hypothetical protein
MKINTKRLLRLKLLLFVSGIALCKVWSAQTSGKTNRNQSTHGEFFFGTSQDVEHCPSAWLIYLDTGRHDGGIFVVAGMEKFSKFEQRADGTLLFQWSGLGDKNYQFIGTLKASELAGEIQLTDVRSGAGKFACDMIATKLSSPADPDHPALAARYSNAAYASEGGDPTGVDIRFFSTNKGTAGMITFHEGYWDEPVDTPLALSQIEVGKGTVKFAAETPKGFIHYHLRLTAVGALFNRDDKDQAGEKSIPLKKGPMPHAVVW